jgi:hypothetical protein
MGKWQMGKTEKRYIERIKMERGRKKDELKRERARDINKKTRNAVNKGQRRPTRIWFISE